MLGLAMHCPHCRWCWLLENRNLEKICLRKKYSWVYLMYKKTTISDAVEDIDWVLKNWTVMHRQSQILNMVTCLSHVPCHVHTFFSSPLPPHGFSPLPQGSHDRCRKSWRGYANRDLTDCLGNEDDVDVFIQKILTWPTLKHTSGVSLVNCFL